MTFPRGSGAGSHDGSVGLGLFIVKEIAQADGATVEVASAHGATTFTLRLRRDRAAASREEAAAGQRAAVATTQGK
jgi:signal transduction histidine kinase